MLSISQVGQVKGGDRVLRAAQILQARRAQRSKLIPFTVATLPRYETNWHHEETAALLDRVAADEILRLMIFEPPRHGKSELTSIRFPAHYLGKHKQRSIICASYAVDLARVFSRAARNTVLGPAYQRLWPYRLAVESDTHWQIAGKEDERNSFIAAGVGGGITGEGANLFLIDDPFKNYEEALSQITRDTVWNWFTSTARTRLSKGGAIVLTMTRWHEDDLAGRLLRLAAEDSKADQWVVIELPACTDGQYDVGKDNVARVWSTDGSVPERVFPPYRALWPERYDVADHVKTHAVMGTRQYVALYDQKPAPATGNIIKREWLRHWYVTPGTPVPRDGTGLRPGYAFETCTVLPDIKDFTEVAQSWDATFKETKDTDFVSGGVWARLRARMYMLDRVCERMDFVKTKKAIKAMTAKWPRATAKYVEDKANGPAIISELKADIVGLVPVEPIGSKEARLSAASPVVEAGNVVLPHPSIAPWIYDFIECLCVFPNGLNDDDCDMFSQAVYKLKMVRFLGLIAYEQQQAAKELQPVNKVQAATSLAKPAPVDAQVSCPHCEAKCITRVGGKEYRCNQCGKQFHIPGVPAWEIAVARRDAPTLQKSRRVV